MNDRPIRTGARQALIGLIRTFGPDLRRDPRRCEALLHSLCPDSKRDVDLLIMALRERIPDDLLAALADQPVPVLVTRLGRQLVDTQELAEADARWAACSWAIALGLASEAGLAAPPPATPPPVSSRAPLLPGRHRPLPSTGNIVRRIIRAVVVACLAVANVMRVIRTPVLIFLAAGVAVSLIVDTVHRWHRAPSPSRAVLPLQQWEAAQSVSAIALSRDGRTVATGGFRLITLWDAATGRKLRDIAITPPAAPASSARDSFDNFFGPQTGEVAQLCFSPDGKRLASSDYGLVTLWNAQTGQKESAPTLPTERVTETVLGDTDGDGFAQGTSTRQVPTKSRHFLLFSPDGRSLLADAGGAGVVAWDAGEGARRALIVKADVSALAFSPDGATLAGGGSDGVIRLWDAVTGRQKCAIRVPSGSAAADPYGRAQYYKHLNAVAFSPDGRTLATDHQDDAKVRFWDAASGARKGAAPVGAYPVEAMTLRPDGTLVCSQETDGLSLRDGATGEALHTYTYDPPDGMMSKTHDSRPRVFALSADGQTLVAGGNGNMMPAEAATRIAVWKVTK